MVSRPFLLFTLPCQWAGWGWAISWEGEQLSQMCPTDPSWPKGYSLSYDIVLSNKNWGVKVWWGWSCSGTVNNCGVFLHCFFFFLVFGWFLFFFNPASPPSLNCLYRNSWVFWHLSFPFSPPSSWGCRGRWGACASSCVVLSCLPELNNDNKL